MEKSVKLDATRRIKRIITASQIAPRTVEVHLVDDDEMLKLNQEWRGKNASTDVLSFSAQEGVKMPGLEKLLGDVVISVDRAKEQSQEYGHGIAQEIGALFAHGLAHLLGFDHELSNEDARKQLQFEMQLLESAGLEPELALMGREIDIDV